jgi:hypothetical protein
MSGPASDGTDAALFDVCEAIRELLARAVRDELLARYRAGSLLSLIKRTPGTYGEHAVDRLAAELGIASPTLYRYAMVAENWTLAEIEAVSVRAGRFGEPLSWSHLVVLTRVTRAAKRRALVDESLARGWSVRKLTTVIGALATPPSDDDAPAEASVRVALTEGIQNATRATVELDIFAEALASRLAELDDDADTDDALVTRAIHAFQELHLRAESTLSQLRGATRASEKRLRCAVPTNPGHAGHASRVAVRAVPDPSEHDEPEERASGDASAARVRRR